MTQRIQISQWFILSCSNAISFLVLSQFPHPDQRDNPNERGKGKGFWGVLFPEAMSGLLVFHDLMIVIAPHRLWLESLASQLDSFVQKVITECLRDAKNHFRLSLEAPALEELVFYLEKLKTNTHTQQRRMIGSIGWGGAILFRVAREDLGDKMAFEWVRGRYLRKGCSREVDHQVQKQECTCHASGIVHILSVLRVEGVKRERVEGDEFRVVTGAHIIKEFRWLMPLDVSKRWHDMV